jgi:ribosomal protein L27
MKKLLFILSLCSSAIGFAQTQRGADIDGEAAGDQSGWSVSMPDANTVAIGAHRNASSGADSGHVRIYQSNGTTWTQKGADIDSEAANDWSGYSVSMPDANTVAIGAIYNDGSAVNAGHVRIYQWNGTAWTQKGADIDGEATNDNSGWSVSMPDANTVAIGAYGNDGSAVNAGHVRIYQWNGTAWTQKGADIDGEATNDLSGSSVSMPDSNTVAIGARRNAGSGTNAGHVRIYQWNGTTWTQKGMDINGEATNDESGWSVSMPDSNTVAIGAPHNNGNGANAGHVRIYQWNGTTWTQKGADINGEAADDQSGWSVSMPDASTVAIGARLNDGSGTNAGHVRIYQWNGTTWTQKGADINGEAAGNQSGFSVSMPDANTVAIGAIFNYSSGTNAGHVRVYDFCTATGVSDLTTNTTGLTITANNTSATYQWLDCTDNAPIVGATSQSFTATANGSYAVMLNENDCVQTSSCVTITTIVAITESGFANGFSIYPNPTSGNLSLDFDSNQADLRLTLISMSGQVISNQTYQNQSLVQFAVDAPAGVYILKVSGSNQQEAIIRIIKQ